MILCLESAEVRTANSINDAMRIMSSWNPQIVISDIAMPGGGGYELIRRLRESGCDAPAIALTARASDEDRRRALKAGFHLHMPKPIEPDDLVESVADLAGRSTKGDRPPVHR
jgi:CheY-like chemotaxis protein